MKIKKHKLQDDLNSYEKDKFLSEFQNNQNPLVQRMGDILENSKDVTIHRKRVESSNEENSNHELTMGKVDHKMNKLTKYQ